MFFDFAVTNTTDEDAYAFGQAMAPADARGRTNTKLPPAKRCPVPFDALGIALALWYPWKAAPGGNNSAVEATFAFSSAPTNDAEDAVESELSGNARPDAEPYRALLNTSRDTWHDAVVASPDLWDSKGPLGLNVWKVDAYHTDSLLAASLRYDSSRPLHVQAIPCGTITAGELLKHVIPPEFSGTIVLSASESSPQDDLSWLANFPNIEGLFQSEKHPGYTPQAAAMIANGAVGLRQLDFRLSPTNREQFEALSRLTDLRHLDLSFSQLSSGALAAFQVSFTALDTLILDSIAGGLDKSTLAPVGSMRTLRFLSLNGQRGGGYTPSGNPGLRDDGIIQLEPLVHLETLRLARCSGLREETVVFLSSHLPSLRCLDLSDSSGMGHGGGVVALRGLTRLSRLDLCGWFLPSWEMKHLVEAIPRVSLVGNR